MEEKIQSSDIDIRINKLTEEDIEKLSSFSCGNDKLDDFFHNEIYICSKYHYVSAYCVKDVQSDEIVAVFTLANDAVVIGDVNDDLEDFIQMSALRINEEYLPVFKQQTSFPAINIGHLGTRADLQSKGIGTKVLDFVLTTFINYDIAGCQFITVDSLNNEKTNKFYMKNGFSNQTNNDMTHDTRRMYLPIELYRHEEDKD